MVDNIQVEKKYRDTVFRLLYKDKKNLLELYNAINGRHYTNANELEVNTLENAVYLNMKNDVSFVLDFEMNLYEHQSTLNPNMPLRDLFYVARLLENEVKGRTDNNSIYSRSIIKIPTPRFVVFYNGNDYTEEKFEYRLSDAFSRVTDKPELELIVTVYNINLGKNMALMEQCKSLREYSLYVDKVRKNLKFMPIDEAVEDAVNYCLENDILTDFLRKNRAEVMKVAIYECDMEKELKKIGNDYYEDGYADGKIEGIIEGKEEGRFDVVFASYKKQIISLDIAATMLNVTTDEFLTGYNEYLNEDKS